jgi:hypothetical protein
MNQIYLSRHVDLPGDNGVIHTTDAGYHFVDDEQLQRLQSAGGDITFPEADLPGAEAAKAPAKSTKSAATAAPAQAEEKI